MGRTSIISGGGMAGYGTRKSDGTPQTDASGSPAVNTIIGGVTAGAGIATHRNIDVVHATLPTIAGSGTVTFATPVTTISIDSVRLSAGVIPLTAANWQVRYAIDAENDAAAALLLPTTPPTGDPTADLGQVGTFNLLPIMYPHPTAASRLLQTVMPAPVELEFSEGITRLDLAHNLGAGVTLMFGIRAIGASS